MVLSKHINSIFSKISNRPVPQISAPVLQVPATPVHFSFTPKTQKNENKQGPELPPPHFEARSTNATRGPRSSLPSMARGAFSNVAPTAVMHLWPLFWQTCFQLPRPYCLIPSAHYGPKDIQPAHPMARTLACEQVPQIWTPQLENCAPPCGAHRSARWASLRWRDGGLGVTYSHGILHFLTAFSGWNGCKFVIRVRTFRADVSEIIILLAAKIND